MILEILDYCLIKSQLIEFSKEEIIEQFCSQESQELWYSALYNLTIDDLFLISDSSVFEKARRIIEDTRFSYSSDKIKAIANEFIRYFNTYLSASKDTSTLLRAEWGQREANLHGLPSGTYKTCELLEYIKYDYYYISYLFNNDEDSVRINPKHAVASIYYLIRVFPDAFKDPSGNVLSSDKNQELLENIDKENAYHKALLIVTFCSQIRSGANRKTRRQAKILLDQLLEMDIGQNAQNLLNSSQIIIKKNKKTVN